MHPNEKLLGTFYGSLQRLDAEAMVACYHPEVTYHDPVFGELRGARAMAMWRMLCSPGNLKVEFRDIWADDVRGGADWDARYLFSKTGLPVHNQIHSSFLFKDGLIVEQRESFSTYKWASMALGWTGRLAGWSPPVKGAIRKEAARALDGFIAHAGSSQ